MFNFNFDFLINIRSMLPPTKRLPKFIALLSAYIKPVRTLYTEFLAFVDMCRYDLSITGQIIYLEKLLNDKFNNGLPAYTSGIPTGIYITDPGDFIFPKYVWNKIEDRKGLILYNKSEHVQGPYLYNIAEMDGQYHYIIHVPYTVGNVTTNALLVAQMKTRLNRYRVAGRNYKIVNY